MIFLLLGCTPTPAASVTCDACGGDCVEDSAPASAAHHVEGDVEHEQSPPSSGDHAECWAAWGVHEEEVPAENWVHNLEHGGVVFLYACPEGCDDELAELTTLVQARPEGRALLTSYPEMEATFAAISWEHRLLLGCFDAAALEAFYDAHAGQAPEDSIGPPSSDCED